TASSCAAQLPPPPGAPARSPPLPPPPHAASSAVAAIPVALDARVTRATYRVTLPLRQTGEAPPPPGSAPGARPLCCLPRPAPLRPDDAPRRLVGDAALRVRRADGVRRLRDVGGVPERKLRVRTVSLALLLAAPLQRRIAGARLVRREAHRLAAAPSLLARTA